PVIPNLGRKSGQAATSKKATSATLPKKATATPAKKRTYQQRNRSIKVNAPPSEETPASSSEDEKPQRKSRKRRAAPVPATTSADTPAIIPDATPKRGKKKPRASLATKSPAPLKSPASKPEIKHPAIAGLQQRTRPPSFLTKAIPVALPSSVSLANNKPRADVWSYTELDGLIWVRLDVSGSEVVIASVDQTEGSLCWWPGEVAQRTPNTLKVTLCGVPPAGVQSLELLPSSLSESNVLTFRRPSTSSVRFSTFKNAYTPPPSTEPSTSSSGPDDQLEQLWKTACARAFEIDTESNDGLEDICLLFSQKTKSTRDDSTQGTEEQLEAVEEDSGNQTDECDVLETETVVLCRYHTRFYPAKICTYYPRGERGLQSKYLCKFADDSTRYAARKEIHTQLDSGFATCPLGDYQKWEDRPPESWVGRPPTPEPRVSSPEPEPESTIDATEYCARERMRDQLRPLLPFLQGFISRTYVPGQSATKGQGGGEGSQREDVLDRHAVYMQGGRTRKSLAYSVHTGDLNEDDCEALMYELSRWALRGDRWAEGVTKAGETGLEVPEIVVREATTDPGGTEDVVDVANTSTSTSSMVYETPPLAEEVKDTTMAEDPDPVNMDVPPTVEAGPSAIGEVEVKDVEMAVEDDTNVTADGEPPAEAVATEAQPADRSTPDTVPEDTGDKTITPDDSPIPENTSFHELVKRQPPRPTGSPEYEQLTPAERLGDLQYISDVLYPEAAALILSYRKGIRTHVGPVSDPRTELQLYTAGMQAAKNTTSQEDWVDKILATRQLREATLLKHVPGEVEQVVVPGGTRSRPKYVTNRTTSTLK
ncbi:hypothetical protein FRC09_014463, partial [Ceratobasidium sp. 395]